MGRVAVETSSDWLIWGWVKSRSTPARWTWKRTPREALSWVMGSAQVSPQVWVGQPRYLGGFDPQPYCKAQGISFCLRDLYDSANHIPVLPIRLASTQDVQKLKLPVLFFSGEEAL